MRKSCILRELCPPEKFANKQFGSLVTSIFSVSNNLNWVTPTHLKMCVFGGGSVGACIWFDYAHHASAVLQTHGAGCLQTQMAADPGGTTPIWQQSEYRHNKPLRKKLSCCHRGLCHQGLRPPATPDQPHSHRANTQICEYIQFVTPCSLLGCIIFEKHAAT